MHHLKISQIKSTFWIKEELNIKISSNNFTTLLRVILKNKEMTIALLKDLTKLNIKDIEFEDLKNVGNSSGYDFTTIKLNASIEKQATKISEYIEKSKPLESNTTEERESEIYIKIIRKDKIKESIFCYWSLLYDENFKDYEASEFTTVINKVKITETENEEYKHSVLLEIKENKWGVLKYGSTIHLIKFEKYLNDKTIKKSKLINDWKKYIEENSEDVLFIGIVNR